MFWFAPIPHRPLFSRLSWNLTSSNIAFFPEANTPPAALVKDPYTIGFNRSRPDDALAFTTGALEMSDSLHRRPEYRSDGARYRPECDYYSLGIMLLEIGLWTRIKEMTEEWKVSSDRILQQELLARQVPSLAAYMGTAYREAVRVCIAGDFGLDESAGGDSKAKPALSFRSEELVVSRLRAPREAASPKKNHTH